MRVSEKKLSWIGLSISMSLRFMSLSIDFASSSESIFVMSLAPKVVCDETLDLLGSDPNNERVKGRSNYVYLLCFW